MTIQERAARMHVPLPRWLVTYLEDRRRIEEAMSTVRTQSDQIEERCRRESPAHRR